MKRPLGALVAAATATLLTLSACSSDTTSAATAEPEETGPVTLNFVWWGNDDRAARYEQALDLFEADNPDITVNANFQAWPDYWTARATEAAGRALPDVMQFDLSYIREYGGNDLLADLGPYVSDGTIDLSGFDETLAQAGVLDGATVGIPTSTNTFAMFINPGVLEATGVELPDTDTWTWEDYNAFAAAVSEAGVQTADGYDYYGTGDYTGTFWFFIQWLLQKGVQPFEDDGTFNFDQSDVVEYLDLTADLRAASQTYPVERTVALTPLGGFTMNEVAAEMTWDNFLAGYTADSGTEDLQMVPIPSVTAGEKDMFFKPSMLYSVAENSEHKAAAATLVDFLLTDPRVGEIFGTSKGVPADEAQRAAVDAEEGSVDATVIAYEEAVADQVTETTPIPVEGWGTIEAKWLTLAQDLAYGNLTPEEFADQWFSEAEMATM